MGRLDADFLDRIESFAHRVVRGADELDKLGRSRRVTDQLLAAGTPVGANDFEADESMSRRDFVKCLAHANKELNETSFWLRLATRNGRVPTDRLEPLLVEADKVRKILGTMMAGVKARDAAQPLP